MTTYSSPAVQSSLFNTSLILRQMAGKGPYEDDIFFTFNIFSYVKSEGCGSSIAFCGSGSSCFFQCGSLRIRIQLKKLCKRITLYRVFYSFTSRLLKSKQLRSWPKFTYKNCNKITIITNFLVFFCYYFLIFPSLILICRRENKCGSRGSGSTAVLNTLKLPPHGWTLTSLEKEMWVVMVFVGSHLEDVLDYMEQSTQELANAQYIRVFQKASLNKYVY